MDQKKELKDKSKDTGPIMFLSLFLLLLAFFILLNALSTYEETRSRKVIQSVASTFQTQVARRNVREILISTLGPVPQPEEVMAEVERLWITAIPLTEVTVLSEGRIMQFEMPAHDLFIGGQTDVREDRKDLIKASAQALAARLEGFTAEMQFVMGVEDLRRVKTTRPVLVPKPAEPEPEGMLDFLNLNDPLESIIQEDTSDDRNYSFARAANFARVLVDAGAPPAGVSIGLLRGDNRNIRMRFYIHPEEESYTRFLNVIE